MLRRLAYVFSAIFLLVVIVVSLIERQSASDRAVAPPVTAASRPAPPVVRGTLPAQRTIEARVGDSVTITVTSPVPDEATIDALGLQTETDPSQPGVIDLVADAPGRYPVTLLDSGRVAGTLVVGPGR